MEKDCTSLQELLDAAKPAIQPPLDPDYRPAICLWEIYADQVTRCGDAQAFALALEDAEGQVSRWETRVLPPGRNDAATRHLVERIAKFLLWSRGVEEGACPQVPRTRIGPRQQPVYCPNSEENSMTETPRLIEHAFPLKRALSAYHCATPPPQLVRVQDPFGKLLVRPFSKSQTTTRTITATVETSGARISQQKIISVGER